MKKSILGLLLGGFLWLVSASNVSAAAPHYTLSPTSGGPYSIGQTFAVVLGIDTIDKLMVLGDIEGRFDVSKLELVLIEKFALADRAFKYDDNVTLKPDNIKGEFGITLSNPNNPSLLQGDVAKGNLFKLYFKAKAEGTASVSFFCESPSTIDSNILIDKEATDMISCSENSSGSYVIKGTPTTTAAPTTAPTTTTTTTLPKAGSTEVTIAVVLMGILSVVGGFVFKRL